MIDPAVEERIVERAVEEGLLTASEVAEHCEQRDRWGSFLAGFVWAGLLSRAAARRLSEDVAFKSGGNGGPPRAARQASPGERFEVGELLGQGGMGKVYKAYDTRLRRPVALKFLRGDEPEQMSRFVREAQAQARVDHENVCRIYEVGELDGKPYITMQYIEGSSLFVNGVLAPEAAPPSTSPRVNRGSVTAETLRSENANGVLAPEAAPSGAPVPSPALQQMTVEQKVRVMQKVAEAIQAAHREGLIHRDIKPSNIMLERTEDGDWKPYVLDFGLAREVASAAVTSLGVVAGTPNFMAPEQARGEVGALDRRTDVYGLGATLYAVLSGKPPFEGPSSLDVLVKVTEEEPPPLTGLPEDLSTIVSKCLQKEPALRYESARGLAEDLGRYLSGEPILARKTSLAYRLRKKARKHKRLVAASGLAAVVFAVMAAASVRTQLQAQKRARLAGVFGQEVKAVEYRMRLAQLLPEHDVTAEKTAIRERMAALAAQVSKIGAVAEGPGHYALGRGSLALREHEKAREDLERAWNGGYRGGEVAYALGQVMGALYQRELEAAERISDKKVREERKKQVETQYRDPALSYLQQARGVEMEAPEYVEALVAFYEKRYEDAVAKAQAAYRRVPGLYEARALEGRIYAAVAKEKVARGARTEGTEAYERAEAAYAAAFVIGRSDSSIPEGLCALMGSWMQTELYTGGATVEPLFRKGLEACSRALAIDPERVEAYQGKARLLWRMGERQFQNGEDPRATLARAVKASEQSLRGRPDDSRAYYAIGVAHVLRGQYEMNHGVDPTESLDQAVRAAEKGLALNPNDYEAHNLRGYVYWQLAMHVTRTGRDPEDLFRKAEECYLQASRIKPDYDIPLSNLAVLSRDRVRYALDHGQDPWEEGAKGLQAAARALEANPKFLLAHYAAGYLHTSLAEHDLALGQDPAENLRKAEESYRSALAINPQYAYLLMSLGQLAQLAAEHALDEGRDAAPSIRKARERVRAALARGPDNVPVLGTDARLAVFEARWRVSRGASPDAALARAQRVGEKLVQLDGSSAAARELLAEVHWWRAVWSRRQGRRADLEITRGLARAEEALAINPRRARALAVRGALHLERAQAEPARRATHRAEAQEALEQALSINRHLAREFGASPGHRSLSP